MRLVLNIRSHLYENLWRTGVYGLPCAVLKEDNESVSEWEQLKFFQHKGAEV